MFPNHALKYKHLGIDQRKTLNYFLFRKNIKIVMHFLLFASSGIRTHAFYSHTYVPKQLSYGWEPSALSIYFV